MGVESILKQEPHMTQESEHVAHGMPSLPTGALDNPEIPQEPQPHHLLEIFNKIDEMHALLCRLLVVEERLLADRIKERTFVDTPVQISKSVEYTVDYLERRYLYLYSPTSLTLSLSNGTTVAVSAGNWTRIAFPRGMKLTAPSVADSAPATVIVRACDMYMG